MRKLGGIRHKQSMLYKVARDWEPRAVLRKQVIAASETSNQLSAVLLPRISGHARECSEFLRTRIEVSNRFYKNRPGWGTTMNPNLVPPGGARFGIIESADIGPVNGARSSFRFGSDFVAYLLEDSSCTAVGFVTFSISLCVDPSPQLLEPELSVDAVWIDPMFRGQGLSSLLVQAVRVGGEHFFDGVPPLGTAARGVKLVVAGDAYSMGGGHFVDACAESIDTVWCWNECAPGGWVFSEIEADARY